MTAPPDQNTAPDPVDLARESDFFLGSALVRPSLCQVVVGADRVRLQPRVMQVLVALARAQNEMVSRDELMSTCWGDVAVGDDSLNRCIQRLRRLAGDVPTGFVIETLPRIGYRLVAAQGMTVKPVGEERARPFPGDEASSTEVRPGPMQIGAAADSPSLPQHHGLTGKTKRRLDRWLIAGGALLLVAAGVAAMAFRHADPAQGVALKPFDVPSEAPVARTFAGSMIYQLSGTLANADVKVAQPGVSPGRPHTAFVIGGRAELSGNDLHVIANIEDAGSSVVLWSGSFVRPVSEASALQEQVSAKVADVVQCALGTSDTSGQGRLPADIETIKLFMMACDIRRAVDEGVEVRDLMKKITQRQPRFARAWGWLATSDAWSSYQRPSDDQAQARTDALAAAHTALRLNPKEGQAYFGLAILSWGDRSYADQYALYRKGVAADPNNADLRVGLSILSLAMGLTREGVAEAQRALELEPLSPTAADQVVRALADTNQINLARSTIERDLRIWPTDHYLHEARVSLALRSGDPAVALRLLDEPDEGAVRLSNARQTELRRLLAVRAHPSPAAVSALSQGILSEVSLGQLEPSEGLLDLANVGAIDAAFRVADKLPGFSITRGRYNVNPPSFLWGSSSGALVRDPRFIPLAARLGLVDFWRSTGEWPDICSAPNWPYDCRAEVAKLASHAS